MSEPLCVLIVEDVASDAELVAWELKHQGFDLDWERVEDEESMRNALDRKPWDVVLCDFGLPRFDAAGALQVLREIQQDTPFIVVSGTIGEEAAVEAMRAGAHDYVMKGRLARLGAVIRRELEAAAARRERRLAEEQLAVAQRLESIGRLAGGVAHDFNNLLTVINSYTDFAREGMSEDDPVSRDLLEVREAGERAAALTRQLLAFSRRELIKPTLLDLNELIANTERMLRRLIGEDLVFRLTLADDVGTIRADPGKVEQVFMNLVVNARDAMPTGGKLTIETADLTVDDPPAATHAGLAPGRYVRVTVTDDGCGMDDETRNRAFEPFFTTKDRDRGTGLGLSTVYGIVKQSGGRIRVDSEVGRGTTFQIDWPAVEGTRPAMPHRTVRPPGGGVETVLVVEDERALRDMVARILGASGYRVVTAADADEALREYEQNADTVDMVLTDVVMPGLSGFELARRLDQLRPGLAVLFMSGYTDDSIAHHGVVDESTPLLVKPFSADDLTGMVRQVLDGAHDVSS